MLDYMPDTSAAILMQSPRGGQMLIYLCAATIIGFIFWASSAELDEIVQGSGKVVPSSRVQVIQILRAALSPGFMSPKVTGLRRGQSLMELDSTRFQSIYREAELEYLSLLVTRDRLQAEVDSQPLLFSSASQQREEYIVRETALFETRKQAQATELNIAREKTRQSRQQLSEMQSRYKHLATSLKLVQKELEMTRPLVQQGAAAEVELLRLEQRVNELDGALEADQLAVPRLESALQASLGQEAELQLKFHQTAMEELKETACA